MVAEVVCPKCGSKVRVAEEQLGRVVRCKRCSEKFTAKATVKMPSSAKETVRRVAKSAPAAAPLPAAIGGFEIRGVLGEGAFGQVLLGYDANLKRLVALKVPHPGTFATPQAIERFEREARAAAQLRHPHIVPIYAAALDSTRCWTVRSSTSVSENVSFPRSRQPAGLACGGRRCVGWRQRRLP